ncbi:MAG: hypothetical protein A2X67_10880 [Ignavibacteria bacterium GWA2_55_11]|nr:MAG: hypothetical protein A2X67_10880 [Ignavibacteria bacterium GWA2_55_11]
MNTNAHQRKQPSPSDDFDHEGFDNITYMVPRHGASRIHFECAVVVTIWARLQFLSSYPTLIVDARGKFGDFELLRITIRKNDSRHSHACDN